MEILGYGLVIIYMCIIPLMAGFIFASPSKNGKSLFVTWAAGLMVNYALYEVLALAFMFLDVGFRKLSVTYLFASLLLSGLGIFVKLRDDKVLLQRRNGADTITKESETDYKLWKDPFFLAAVILIAIQVGAILILATPDKDDAFYSGLSSMCLSYDYILEKNAYHGLMETGISKRYAISALPAYQASLSYLSEGLHHLVITHNLFPLFYMPLAYGLFYSIAKEWLKEKKMLCQSGKFLFLFALLHMFGNYYVFSPENFLVTRIWQGKALFVALGVPFLWIVQGTLLDKVCNKESFKALRADLILLICTLFACTFWGETGLYLGPLLVMGQSLSYAMEYKKIKPLFYSILACIPQGLLLLMILLT